MMTRLRKLWSSRSPKEQAAALVLLAFVSVALYFWFTYAATQARARLKTSVAALRTQSAEMERHAVEILRLRGAPPATPAAAPVDLRATVQAQIDSTGLSSALVKIDVQSAHAIQVTLGTIPFASWLALVRNLQMQRIRLETCRVEALATSGMVSVTATLASTRPQ